jgi:hypothetical protein
MRNGLNIHSKPCFFSYNTLEKYLLKMSFLAPLPAEALRFSTFCFNIFLIDLQEYQLFQPPCRSGIPL